MFNWEDNQESSYNSGNRNSSFREDREKRAYGGGDRDRGDRDGYRRQDQRGERDNRDRRGGGGGGGGRSYEFSETIDVRRDCVGMIIGRAGSNIQRIQSDNNVRVDIDKNTNVATISSNSEGNIKDAVRSMQDQMDNAESGGGRDNRRGGDGGGSSYRRHDDGGSSYRRHDDGGSSSYRRHDDGGSSSRRNTRREFFAIIKKI